VNTPGHISLELAGGDGRIVVGDAVPHATVAFAHPEWRFGFDAIPDLASATGAGCSTAPRSKRPN
jgi:glyoxylase-like metal-dependent hydrolase (beta-lactamase superfamily II)